MNGLNFKIKNSLFLLFYFYPFYAVSSFLTDKDILVLQTRKAAVVFMQLKKIFWLTVNGRNDISFRKFQKKLTIA